MTNEPQVPGFPPELTRSFVPLRQLGRGAMGTVFLARDRNLGREVAVKLLQAGSEDEQVARFEREARALAKVRHENIVKIYDHGLTEGRPWIAMEFLEGRSSDQLAPVDEPLDILLPIAGALEAIHEAGIVHRDLKPANLMVTDDGRPVLVDFGLMRKLQQTVMTREEVVVGTPSYMAPEILRGAGVSPPGDWYAWGVCLYVLAEGQSPWGTDQVLAWATRGEVPLLRFRRVEPGNPVATLVRACLAEDPGLRPRRCRDLERLREEGSRVRFTRPLAAAPAGVAVGAPGRAAGTAGRDSVRARALSTGSAELSSASGRPLGWRPRLVVAGWLAVLALAGGWWVGEEPRRPAPPPPPPSREVVEETPAARRQRELEAVLATLEPVGENARGFAEYRNPRDGSVLILVPATTYPSRLSLKGEPPGEPREVRVGAYLLGKYEVTVEQFVRFFEEGTAAAPGHWSGQLDQPELPLVFVSWHDADAYCRWAGGRLPTIHELERAAAGTDQRDYPWGSEEPTPELATFGHSGLMAALVPFDHIRPPGSFPLGMGPVGTLEQAGNVSEWSASPPPGIPDAGDDERVTLGGSYFTPPDFLTTYSYRAWRKGDPSPAVGFRMAMGPP